MCQELKPVYGEVNPLDKIGVKIKIKNACTQRGQAKKKLSNYFPQNGEYEYAGAVNDCSYSSQNDRRQTTCASGCFNHLKSCAFTGDSIRYKRKKYRGPTEMCCLGRHNYDGTINMYSHGNMTTLSCDPETKKVGSSKCDPIFKNYCGNSTDKLFNDELCQNYCGYGTKTKDWCATKKYQHCNSVDKLKNDNGCKKFCRQNLSTCKVEIEDYCTDYKLWSQDICTSYCAANPTWCNNKKKAYCEAGDNLKNNSNCIKFCGDNLGDCATAIEAKCTGNTVFTDDLCKSYCIYNPEWCKITKQKYCDKIENVNKDECKTFCSANHGFCDNAMKTYCSNNPKNETCLCILSKVGKYNPLCVDTQCINKGYATNSMLESKSGGCNIVDCSQYLSVRDSIAGGDLIVEPEFLEKCGSILSNTNTNTKTTKYATNTNNTKNTTNNKTLSVNTQSTITKETPDNRKKSNTITIVIITIFSLLIIGFIILISVVTQKVKKTNKYYTENEK